MKQKIITAGIIASAVAAVAVSIGGIGHLLWTKRKE